MRVIQDEGKQPVCLTIAGLDPSGGAGIIADIKTFTSFGCFAAAAISSVTFQNTTGVFGAVHQSAESVRRQIDPVLDDYKVAAIKTGMLPSREVIKEVARILQQHKINHIVVDPVVRSTSGFDLIDDLALEALIERLFPLADLITPNIPEAERITGIKIDSPASIRAATEIMRSLGAKNVLIKGGHLANVGRDEGKSESEARIARDYLFIGGDSMTFEAEFIETTATHGTGCTLSAAIAANLANGIGIADSVRIAKNFVTEAIRTATNLGKGNSPINI
jgi:hydroxymethylpyrimidine/phosphomethylpyrimidine kinase